MLKTNLLTLIWTRPACWLWPGQDQPAHSDLDKTSLLTPTWTRPACWLWPGQDQSADSDLDKTCLLTPTWTRPACWLRPGQDQSADFVLGTYSFHLISEHQTPSVSPLCDFIVATNLFHIDSVPFSNVSAATVAPPLLDQVGTGNCLPLKISLFRAWVSFLALLLQLLRTAMKAFLVRISLPTNWVLLFFLVRVAYLQLSFVGFADAFAACWYYQGEVFCLLSGWLSISKVIVSCENTTLNKHDHTLPWRISLWEVYINLSNDSCSIYMYN